MPQTWTFQNGVFMLYIKIVEIFECQNWLRFMKTIPKAITGYSPATALNPSSYHQARTQAWSSLVLSLSWEYFGRSTKKHEKISVAMPFKQSRHFTSWWMSNDISWILYIKFAMSSAWALFFNPGHYEKYESSPSLNKNGNAHFLWPAISLRPTMSSPLSRQSKRHIKAAQWPLHSLKLFHDLSNLASWSPQQSL